MGNAFILHGCVEALLVWHLMLMRNLFDDMLGLIFYSLLEVFSFQESLAIRCILCFYCSCRILRLLVITVGVVQV